MRSNFKFYSVAQIAERLSVCPKTVRRLISSGKLHTHKVGRVHRISEEDLSTYMAGGRR
jgi:excisionase family DNA binding protein